jgi:hypothetical protein
MKPWPLSAPLSLALFLVFVRPVPASPVQSSQGEDQNTVAASAQESSQGHPLTGSIQPSDGGLKYGRFHKVLGRNLTTNLFSKNNLLPFLIGSGAALGIAPADQEISDAMRSVSAPTVRQGEWVNTGQIVGGIVTASSAGRSWRACSKRASTSVSSATPLPRPIRLTSYLLRD